VAQAPREGEDQERDGHVDVPQAAPAAGEHVAPAGLDEQVEEEERDRQHAEAHGRSKLASQGPCRAGEQRREPRERARSERTEAVELARGCVHEPWTRVRRPREEHAPHGEHRLHRQHPQQPLVERRRREPPVVVAARWMEHAVQAVGGGAEHQHRGAHRPKTPVVDPQHHDHRGGEERDVGEAREHQRRRDREARGAAQREPQRQQREAPSEDVLGELARDHHLGRRRVQAEQ
jgi:hypothetical protein